ncbi:MAG: DUF2231 domain-containing protein [Steroidobacteraceae bacterium]
MHGRRVLRCPPEERLLRYEGMSSQPLSSNPRSTASVGGHPLHTMLVPIPIVCFVATLVTDIVYWRTAAMLWADMSAWLLLAGLIVAVFAVAAGLIDFLGDGRIRELRAAWVHLLGNVAVLVLSIFNELIHTRDAYTSVVPTGLVLSAVVVLILLLTGWNGWTMVYRHGVGVLPADSP